MLDRQRWYFFPSVLSIDFRQLYCADNHDLSLKQLTHKLVILLALANADRSSDLAALDVNRQYRQGMD